MTWLGMYLLVAGAGTQLLTPHIFAVWFAGQRIPYSGAARHAELRPGIQDLQGGERL